MEIIIAILLLIVAAQLLRARRLKRLLREAGYIIGVVSSENEFMAGKMNWKFGTRTTTSSDDILSAEILEIKR